jgi:hypothetical protein
VPRGQHDGQQQQFSISVWAGIAADWLVDAHVLPKRPAASHRPDLLLQDLQELLEDVPLAVRARMWYMPDYAQAHCSRAVRDVLSNSYHGQWIGRGEHAA